MHCRSTIAGWIFSVFVVAAAYFDLCVLAVEALVYIYITRNYYQRNGYQKKVYFSFQITTSLSTVFIIWWVTLQVNSSWRSGSFEFGRKNHKSVLSRTILALKICRGDPLISQIGTNVLKHVEQEPCKVANFSENNEIIGKEASKTVYLRIQAIISRYLNASATSGVFCEGLAPFYKGLDFGFCWE